MRRTWPRMLGAPAAIFTVLALAQSPAPERASQPAPDFSLPQVRGGLFHLHEHPAQATLLAFVETVPDTADTPSRGEAVFVSSMAHQYGRRGLRVAVIDASALISGRPPQRDALVNASYDWHLEIPLLVDTDSRVARAFRVTRPPTIILLAPDGSISQRWDGFTRPAVLAQGIEKLLGGPLGSIPKIR